MEQIIRTKHDGCFAITRTFFGAFLKPIEDPDAHEIPITKNDLETFELREDLKPIPAELWQKWISLAFHYCKQINSTSEVSVRLLVNELNGEWRILVPRQEVSGGSVRANDFNDSIDIATGEVITEYPPQGWTPCGSSHSHNTMAAFFSGTDDRYEIGDPGLHIVVGSLKTKPDGSPETYHPKASITANRRRYDIDYKLVIDTNNTAVQNYNYHPDVENYVTIGLTQASPQAWGGKTYLPSAQTVGQSRSDFINSRHSRYAFPRNYDHRNYDDYYGYERNYNGYYPGQPRTLTPLEISQALRQAAPNQIIQALEDTINAYLADIEHDPHGLFMLNYAVEDLRQLLDEVAELNLPLAPATGSDDSFNPQGTLALAPAPALLPARVEHP